MKPITVVVPYSSDPSFKKNLSPFTESELVERVVILSQKPVHFEMKKCNLLVAGPLTSHKTVALILNQVSTEYLLLLLSSHQASIEPQALNRILAAAESTKVGLVYSDFYDNSGLEKALHPLNDYRLGSVRDDFDFGAIMLLSMGAARHALKKYGTIPAVRFAALYDLRLKISIDHFLRHLPEPLYSVVSTSTPSSEGRLFAYVDLRNQAAQREMERVFTAYLKDIGAYLAPRRFRKVEPATMPYPVEASVVIPVLNRKGTIAEAVKSALSQVTDFLFNVIVVDNHSTDGTTEVLSDLARQHSRLNHIVPVRTDLAIGGCWNEALHSEACGRYAVQLDSDDLYRSAGTLQRIVDMLRQDNYAMVIGSYTLVNEKLEEIPPGLIDHREWTDKNGRNNALRINGLGAPRAFNTELMRSIGFLNVSYGEDYAACLRVSREYRIGRIYDSLYLCRRWSGNTDARLSIEEVNRNNAFKDEVRSAEIMARQNMNRNHADRVMGQGSRVKKDVASGTLEDDFDAR
ncbi:MAG TPA: glycosyltransferase family 2 protein [Syntrophorhabdales bacterium]|nr:glycosyltransferase family 2 protein [Syntrophorhabdales bacterium]